MYLFLGGSFEGPLNHLLIMLVFSQTHKTCAVFQDIASAEQQQLINNFPTRCGRYFWHRGSPLSPPCCSLFKLALPLAYRPSPPQLYITYGAKRVGNFGTIQPYSFELNASSNEEHEDVHRSSHLQVNASEWYGMVFKQQNLSMIFFLYQILQSFDQVYCKQYIISC